MKVGEPFARKKLNGQRSKIDAMNFCIVDEFNALDLSTFEATPAKWLLFSAALPLTNAIHTASKTRRVGMEKIKEGQTTHLR